MPYIGNTIRAADDYRLIDDISSGFNGSTTSFALQVAGSAPVPFPKSPQQVLISVNGVIQEPDPTGASGFNLVGTNIVFSSAPTNGHAFFGIIYATADYLNAGGNFPSGSLGAPSITFIGDENTGLYRKGSGSVGFVSDATEIANFDSNGITISSGNLILGDSAGTSSDRVVLGASSDLSIYHDGSHSRIDETGTGNLMIQSNNAVFIKKGTAENIAVFNADGAVELYHDNVKKLETKAQGIIISNQGNNRILDIHHTDGTSAYISFQDSNTTDNASVRLGAEGDEMKIFAGNSERVRIDASGNVGIGKTSPSANLHIQDGSGNAEIKLQGGASTANDVIAFLNSAGSTRGNITYDTDNDFVLFNVNTAERMRISSAGLVGIGTSSPGCGLHIDNPNDAAITQILDTDNSAVKLVFRNNTETGNNMQIGADGSNLVALTGATERIRIDSAGRVGIGTSSMGSHQLVSEGGKAETGGSCLALKTSGGASGVTSDLALYGTFVSPTSDQATRRTADIVSGFAANNWGNEFLAFHVGKGGSANDAQAVTDERMRLLSDGGVLIGTQTSAENLRLAEKFAIVGVDVAYPGMNITEYNNTNANHAPIIDFQRSRSTTDGGHTIVQSGDKLGELIFRGADGNGFSDSAAIRAFVDTTPADQDMPGRLTFSTCPDGSITLTERMRIDSKGQVTKGYQPAFYANAGATRNGFGNAVIPFSNTHYNIGSNYDTSNGRFTAPVAGIYIFGGSPGYVETAQTYSVTIRKNGSTITEVQRVIQGDFPSHSMFGFATALSLAANDYVDLFQNNSMHQNSAYSHWFGYLLG